MSMVAGCELQIALVRMFAGGELWEIDELAHELSDVWNVRRQKTE